MFRNLWENIRKAMPKKERGKSDALDPLALPTRDVRLSKYYK
jgi:type III restriction enzyme